MKNKILSVISVWFIALYTINAQIVLQKQTERDGIVTSEVSDRHRTCCHEQSKRDTELNKQNAGR